MSNYNYRDLTGKTFGRLTVISRAENIGRYTAWLCRCSCGTLKVVAGICLGRNTISCGCYQRELHSNIRKKTATHGLSNTRIYRTWRGMMRRCYSKDSRYYRNYGGIGITICPEWHDVSNFKDWAMDNGYSEDLTIERKNVDGNYEPSNCTWIPFNEQSFNKHTTRYVTINGVTLPLTKWARLHGLKSYVLIRRLELGWTGKKLLKPVDKRFSHAYKPKNNLNKEAIQ